MHVDVILTTFEGRREWLIEAIGSVLGQTYEDWHLTVVDDCSPDDKRGFIEERYGRDDRISAIRLERNAGPFGAKTAGIRHTSADVIALLDDDDRWHPEKLALQMERLARKPTAHAVHTDVRYIDEDGRVIARIGDEQNAKRAAIDYESMNPQQQARSLFKYYSVRSSTNAFLRSAFEDAGGYDLSLRDGGDKELWVRFAASGHRIAHLPQPLYDRRIHRSNISKTDRLKYVEDKLRTTDTLVAKFPFLIDLAPARKRQTLREAITAGLEEGRGAATRALVRQLREFDGVGTEVAAAWTLSWLGPLSSPLFRLYRRVL